MKNRLRDWLFPKALLVTRPSHGTGRPLVATGSSPASHFVGQKHPGGLFALDVGVKGLMLPAFRG